MVPVAGRLAAVAEGGPAVGLVRFLFGSAAAESGRLGLGADKGLAFVAAGFVEDAEAAGFMGFQKAKSGIKTTKQNKKTKNATTTTTTKNNSAS